MMHLIPAGLMILPILLAVAALLFAKRRHSAFLNPLTASLARPPGAGLGRKLGAEQLEVGFNLFEVVIAAITPIVVYIHIKSKLLAGDELSVGLFVWAFATWCLWVGYVIWKLMKRFARIRALRLAYECELAVGQELDQLMLDGYRVFHDVQMENFNIDHIVIGQSGVFAVETNGHSKHQDTPDSDRKLHQVTYENGVLNFPGWEDKQVLQKVAYQADLAARWLSDVTGFDVPVQPILVLPGWKVENKGRPVVPVITSGSIQRYFQSQCHLHLNHRDMQQIIFQVDQKGRGMLPRELGRPLSGAA
tara:strand:+ start:74538 stop:75452 length:915 start_codon:yes stop_codon:yes gene_type:complete